MANPKPIFLNLNGKVTATLPTISFFGGFEIQTDGKMILAKDTELVRFKSDGTFDANFGDDGIAYAKYGANSFALALNDKILVTGVAGDGSRQDTVITRLNKDGKIDATFGTNGVIITDLNSNSFEHIRNILVQPDGKFVVVGSILLNKKETAVIARFNQDGSLDQSFGGDGIVVNKVGDTSWFSSVQLQADGNILASGVSDYDFVVTRFLSNGNIDTSFNGNGTVTTNFRGSSIDINYSIAVHGDGKIVAIGESDNFLAIARYNKDGSLDTNFSSDGIVRLNLNSENLFSKDTGKKVSIQPDGKILVAVEHNQYNNSVFVLVRFNQDGSLDNLFGSGGVVFTDLGFSTSAQHVSLLADGKIVVSGSGYKSLAIAKYNSDGSLDTSFGNSNASYVINGSPVIMDNDIRVYDPYYYSNSYNRASLTLVRNGGANSDDLFSGAGIVPGQSNGNVTILNVVIGKFTYSAGELRIDFNSAASQNLVDQALQSLSYSNKSSKPNPSIQIDWIFNDNNTGEQGSGGPETAFGSTLVSIGARPLVINGSKGDDLITGESGNDHLFGGEGNDLLEGKEGNDAIDGGSGTDTAVFSGKLSSYKLSHDAKIYTITAKTGTDGTDLLSNVETLRFSDVTVNLSIQGIAATTPQTDVQRLIELYVAFFNRVPEADGLAYWLGEMRSGKPINAIADIFYEAGVAFSELTGFTANMSNADFVNVIFRNVLGRTEGADPEGLAYWSTELMEGRATRGSLVSVILDSAHSFKGNANWGWVANLLDNKIAVAKTFAIDWGLGYASSEVGIVQGMAIAAAVTPSDTQRAIELIGVANVDMQLS